MSLKYVSKSWSKENIGLTLGLDGHLTINEEEKVEALNSFIASVFNRNTRSGAARTSELEDHD